MELENLNNQGYCEETNKKDTKGTETDIYRRNPTELKFKLRNKQTSLALSHQEQPS